MATDSAVPRVLFCGDVFGQLTSLFKRVTNVNKKNGPFDALFCVGQFFPNDDTDVKEMREYFEGVQKVPLPTYFTGGYGAGATELLCSAKSKAQKMGITMEGIEVCKNLYWLRGSGRFLLKGLSIVYLGGKCDMSVYQNIKHATGTETFHEDDVDTLRAFADERSVTDFFLTNEWPQGIINGIKADETSAEFLQSVSGSRVIAEIAAELKPRYHIAGSGGVFYTRDPYFNEGASHVTRFVGLAAVGNDKQQKFLHALSSRPATCMSSAELSVRPANTTTSPYNRTVDQDTEMGQPSTDAESLEGQYWRYDTPRNKRQKRADTEGNPCFEFISKGTCSRGALCRFRHDLGNGVPIPKNSCYDFLMRGKCERGADCKFRHPTQDNMEAGSNGVPKGKTSDFCWFCLSSPDVESHLVFSIGDHCYCTLAKGPLVRDHILLLPIEHVPSMFCLSASAETELQRYKDAFRRCCNSFSKSLIVFERNLHLRLRTGNSHAHLQIIPIPSSKASDCRDAFQNAASQHGFEFEITQKGENVLGLRRSLRNSNYFYVELPDGTILTHSLAAEEKIPMQFGREVVAQLLDMPERADWKECKVTKEEEVEMVEEFKRRFSEFDPMQSS